VNQLTVSLQHSITTLAAKGWSARKTARELGVHRETVGRHLLPTTSKSKPAIPPIGSANSSDTKPANVPPPGPMRGGLGVAGGFWAGCLGSGGRAAAPAAFVSPGFESFAQGPH